MDSNDGKSLAMAAATCRWFYTVIMHEIAWKFVCFRDLQVPAPCQVAFNHPYDFRDNEKHIVWMRIGAFFFDSKVAHLSERLNLPLKIINRDEVEKVVESYGACVPSNIREGIWIADLQLVRCPVCELDICEGELKLLYWITIGSPNYESLCERFRNESQNYELIGSYTINKFVGATSGGIFDLIHIKDHILKRKEVDEVSDDFFDFSLFAPARTIRQRMIHKNFTLFDKMMK
ncbi:F-box protein [Salix suchowensis]|nr:F-box protein [Salix suchowensis]